MKLGTRQGIPAMTRNLFNCLLAIAFLASPMRGAESIVVKVNAAETRPEINQFIYGQFIEHLGRCVYGGIWAEMLEDRKFYFPITGKYAPYKSLQNTSFPVVGASPWRVLGDPEGVTMDAVEPFVGDHSPRVLGGCGIEQLDLAVEKGHEYVGYVWLKGKGKATVRLNARPEISSPLPVSSIDLPADYEKREFAFTAPADCQKASLRIEVADGGEAHIGTISLMPADNVRGMRADTLALLKQLNSPVYRWPGGNFVSGYDWRDGIGPRDTRPPRKNPAWTGVEHNDVGIDEFINFCREVDAEPMIAANTGFGDAYSAAQEVEYCNGGTDTIGGGWRAENGSREPFEVKYWCVGNEMFGTWQLGYMQLDHYTLKHNLFANEMRKVDPNLVLVGVGDLGGQNSEGQTGWTEGMLRNCAGHMDLISEHFYVGRTPWTETGQSATVAQHVAEMRSAIRVKAEGHRKLQDELGLTGKRRIPIAMDEWNYWHRDYVYGELGCRYDLADALGVAVGLHEFFRSSDIIHMAHYAQTVNVIGCIKTTKTDAFLATTALPLIAYREHFGDTPVSVDVIADKGTLDVVAALTKDGSALTIGVVNASPEAQSIRLDLSGVRIEQSGRAWVVSGKDAREVNDETTTRVEIQEEVIPSRTKWQSPGYSFAVLRWNIE